MKLRNSLAAAITALTISGVASAETIKIAVWYTDPAAQHTGDISVMVDNLISTSNRIYENNGLDIQLELVDSREYSKEDLLINGDNLTEFSGLTEAFEEGIGTLDEVAQVAPGPVGVQRQLFEADMVALLGKGERVWENGVFKGTRCGVAWPGYGSNGVMHPSAKRLAYSMTAVDCGGTDLTFIHELGHNMGLAHSRTQGDTNGFVYYWGLGYGVNDSFSTIMAYPSAFGSEAVRLDTFSDPDKICNGFPCGQRDRADAHRALEPIIDDVAGYY
ncbi:zinc-dependent metalloprotease family protein [Microbulbifer sp. CnH-101-E]|uniref:zinc-dependent metalloprotease family protein n=1 Tax=unclassified Microbulbifer TaxID=2619833 RepID=UPI004039395D